MSNDKSSIVVFMARIERAHITLGHEWGVEISPGDIVYREAPFDDEPYLDVTVFPDLIQERPLETVIVFDEFIDKVNGLLEEELGTDIYFEFVSVARYIGKDPEPEEIEIAEEGGIRATLNGAPESSYYRLVYRITDRATLSGGER